MRERRKIVKSKAGSKFIGDLPIGCKLCHEGAKAVIFITGICYEKCYYCPISVSRRNKDVIFVNNKKVKETNDILEELYAMKALGASITGGEPLIFPSRVIDLIKNLKDTFGEEFHIHLYTIGKQASKELILKLYDVGLDEIRFHVINYSLLKKAKYAVQNTGMDVGIEVPVVPGNIRFYKKLIKQAEKYGVKFVNLNELEISEGNYKALLERNMRLRENRIAAVQGSEEEALKILNWATYNTTQINIHYCSALFKDIIQTRRRFLRKALNIAKAYEKVSREGLVLRGLLETSVERKNTVFNLIREVPSEYSIENGKLIVYLPVEKLKIISNKLKSKNIPFKAFIIEEYPEKTRTVKNVIPLYI